MAKGGDRDPSYEEALEQLRSFRTLADRAQDIIARYEVLPEPRMVYISPAAERITGYPLADFYDDPHLHLKLVHPDDRDRLALLIQRTPDELSIPITMRWVHKDGHTIWIEQRIVPEVDDSGRVAATDSISRDVSDQVRLEHDLRRAQKLEAVGRLAGGIAHDFNNLLGVTLLCAERLRHAVDGDEKLSQWVRMILESAHRGADLTQQLLDFARREARVDGHCELNQVVRKLQPMLARLLPEDVHLRVRAAAEESRIGLDQGQLEQILVNLVVNARDAMPRGGVLTIGTGSAPAASAAARRGGPADDGAPRGVELHVSDTGVGIPEDLRDRIFEPFFTTKEATEGSGMGLSVVYGIVKQSSGQIEVRSAESGGTVFTLRWPLVSAAQAEEAPPAAAPAPGGTETLLLVEDDPLLRRLEAEMLRSLGYSVLEAGTVEEAERLFVEEPGPVPLLLTDVVLPDGSGVTLAERLHERSVALQVVYTTGHTDAEMTRHGLPEGQLMLVTKPFTEGELALVVRAALDGAQDEAEAAD